MISIFLGKAESLGTVEKGKIADLVLLEANPLEHIDNTRRIAAVVLGGELFEKPRLDAMLADAEKLANQKSIAEILMKTIEEQNVATAVRQYHDLKTREPNTYDFRESELNLLGYRLLGAKKVKDAIEIFKLNVVAYPQSSDVYNCLGEIYKNFLFPRELIPALGAESLPPDYAGIVLEAERQCQQPRKAAKPQPPEIAPPRAGKGAPISLKAGIGVRSAPPASPCGAEHMAFVSEMVPKNWTGGLGAF